MIARNQELRQREAQPMEYFSFDLRLGDWNPQTHTGEAEVLYSPAGEGRRYRFLLELDIEATAQRTHRTPAEAMGLGRALFESVFTEASLSLWRESYQIARERGRGLRLRLHINSWELGRVPWELLYDPRQGEFLVFDPHVSVVRYIRIGSSPPILRQTSTLKIMAVVASPQDLTQLDCDGEIKMLRQALQELIASGQVELIVSQHTTHEKLHMELLDHQPDVVHFVGHGEYVEEERAGYLILEDDRGLSHRLNATEAARMLRRYGTNLVLLNACETATGAWAGLAPALVRAEVAAVVAMQWPVEDRAAVRFTRSFYKALAQGRSIDECMAEGRVGASAASDDPNDWTAPVLFLRSISGQLWTQDLRRAPGKRPAEASAAQAFLPTFRGFAPEQEALFKTRGPLLSATDIDLIIDRPALQRALRIARQPSVTQYVAILSARQTGKTTLLLRLRDLLQGDLVCIFIDLSVLSAQDVSACFGFVAFRLLSELRELLGDDLPMLATRQVDSSVEFLEFLRELADNVAVPRIVLLIDEVGALAPDVSDSFFNTLRTVFTEGRTLTGRLAKYLFVFSGAVDLYTLTSGNNSPLNICEKIYLNDFDLDDVRKIVAQFGKLGVSLAEGVAERVYHHAKGHPYLTSRLCALMEHRQLEELGVQHVDEAAEAILVEDDNLRHVIRELERRPAERRRLRDILLEGRQVPFSRNDPVLASLEMIGAIRPLQPCQVRNPLYERALRRYFAESEPEREESMPLLHAWPREASEPEMIYERLLALHDEALTAEGAYKGGKPWETFVAALFAAIPAFALYPDAQTQRGSFDLVLTIKPHHDGNWDKHGPAALVDYVHLPGAAREAFVAETLAKARECRANLVFVLATGAREVDPGEVARYHGTYDGITLVLLEDEELAQRLRAHEDLDAWLRERTLEARLGTKRS